MGISQSELARRTNQARSTVFNWENNRNNPEVSAGILIAEALNTSISYLYGETDDPRPARDWNTAPSSATKAEMLAIRAELERVAKRIDQLVADQDKADLTEQSPDSDLPYMDLQTASERLMREKRSTSASGIVNPKTSGLKAARKLKE